MRSIYRQLSRELFLIGTLLVGLALCISYRITRAELQEIFDESLSTRAYAVSSLTDQYDGKVAFDFSDDFFSYFENESASASCFQIRDMQGKRLFASQRDHDFNLPVSTKGTAAVPEIFDFHAPDGRAMRVISFSFNPRLEEGHKNRDPNLRLIVSVATETTELASLLSLLSAVAVLSWILFTGLLFFCLRRTLRRGLKPLKELSQQVNAIDEKKTSWRVSLAKQPSEIQPVIEQLNALLERLENSFARERRFNSAVAHELRTPIAELRSLAECALTWPDSRDASADRETLAIAERMESTVSRLVAISRGELQKLRPEFAPLRIDDEIRAACRQIEPAAAGKNLTLRIALEPKRVEVDPIFFRSVVENLLDNAVEYSPENGEISVTGKTAGDDYTLEFCNAAPELSPGDLNCAFEPFWRKDAARSNNRHTGLGLSLARAYVDAMGQTLSAALTPDARIVFTFKIGKQKPDTGGAPARECLRCR